MKVMQRKLTYFACVFMFIICLIWNKITFFPKKNTHSKILKDSIQTSISSHQTLIVHSEKDLPSGYLLFHEEKISPMGVNQHNTSSKDVNSHHEEVKEVNNSNKANVISKSGVHDPCNDSLCLNYLSGEVMKKFQSCQKIYKNKLKSKAKRISNISESCHFRDEKGKLIIK